MSKFSMELPELQASVLSLFNDNKPTTLQALKNRAQSKFSPPYSDWLVSDLQSLCSSLRDRGLIRYFTLDKEVFSYTRCYNMVSYTKAETPRTSSCYFSNIQGRRVTFPSGCTIQGMKPVNKLPMVVIDESHMMETEYKVADQIANRINAENGNYFARDNISAFIKEGELEQLQSELEKAFQGVLRALVINPADPNSDHTPYRLAKMYLHEIMSGRYYPEPVVRAFPNIEDGYTGLQVKRTEITSMCSHHHQMVKGIAYIGVLPGESMMGLSKFDRIADWYARRGTLQEELTRDICLAVSGYSETEHVMVQILARHGCCEHRGVKNHNSMTATNYGVGSFISDPSLRSEFLETVRMMRQGD